MNSKDFLEKIKRDFSLKAHNTMRLESVARYFLKAESEKEVANGVAYARDKKLPFLVIGRGSNIILPPVYSGMIILMAIDTFKVTEEDGKVVLYSLAGAYLPEVARKVTEKKGKGMEWAGGVPGTVGGAVRGNAGAFDSSTSDYLKEVKALDTETLEEKTFSKEECLFGYRNSIFKKEGKHIILSAKMEFPKKNKEDGKFQEYLDYRKKRHPSLPSAGSFFKNPEVGEEFYANYPEAEKFRELGFVPAAFLIEKCGLKGEKIGGAEISEKHAVFLVNSGEATKKDVERLSSLVKKRIKEKFGIDIEEEVEVIGG